MQKTRIHTCRISHCAKYRKTKFDYHGDKTSESNATKIGVSNYIGDLAIMGAIGLRGWSGRMCY